MPLEMIDTTKERHSMTDLAEILPTTERPLLPPTPIRAGDVMPTVDDGKAENESGDELLLMIAEAIDVNLGSRSAKKKKKSKSSKKQGLDVGTSRGIESMLRNSYRAQLAMIALAARKANIMISVNGFLLSLLTVGSAYVLTSAPYLLIPSGIFLVTCITAILFAVLAARPQRVDSSRTRLKDFRKERADLLVFEQFSNLSKEDHMAVMLEMMGDKERVYRSMVAHLHFLGQSANRRFETLRISYNAFIIGLIASCVALAAVVAIFYL